MPELWHCLTLLGVLEVFWFYATLIIFVDNNNNNSLCWWPDLSDCLVIGPILQGQLQKKPADHNCWDDGEARWEDLGWQSEDVVWRQHWRQTGRGRRGTGVLRCADSWTPWDQAWMLHAPVHWACTPCTEYREYFVLFHVLLKWDVPCLCCGGGGGGGGGGAVMDAGSYKDFTTQYAKSGKSTCRGCKNKIDKVRHEAVIIISCTWSLTWVGLSKL